MAFQPAEAPAISGCSLIPPTTLGQKDAPERGAPGAKENGSMTKHVLIPAQRAIIAAGFRSLNSQIVTLAPRLQSCRQLT